VDQLNADEYNLDYIINPDYPDSGGTYKIIATGSDGHSSEYDLQ